MRLMKQLESVDDPWGEVMCSMGRPVPNLIIGMCRKMVFELLKTIIDIINLKLHEISKKKYSN